MLFKKTLILLYDKDYRYTTNVYYLLFNDEIRNKM